MKVLIRSLIMILVLSGHAVPVRPLELNAGTRFGFQTRPAEVEDPYAFGLFVGAYLEVNPWREIPLSIGLTLLRSAYAGRVEDFGESVMTAPGLALSYAVHRISDDSISWALAPYLEYRHYIREHSFQGEKYVGRRPMSSVGLQVISRRENGISTGIAIEYLTAWDNKPVHMIGCLFRLGFHTVIGAGEE